jgi:hypothetical protein
MQFRAAGIPLVLVALSTTAWASPPTLFVSAGLGDLARIDLSSGNVTSLGVANCGYPKGAIAVRAADLFIAQQCGYLVQANAVSGSIKSRVETVTRIYGMAFDGTSLIAIAHEQLLHLDPQTGAILDERTLPDSGISLALAGETVFVAMGLGPVYKGLAAGGPLTLLGNWGVQVQAIAASGGSLLVATPEGGLFRVNAITGAMESQTQLPEPAAAIVVDGPMAYLGSLSGTIRRMDIATNTIVGTLSAGIPANNLFLAANPCPADFNGDGDLNVNDFLAFQNGFAARAPAADYNRDGGFNVNDFLAFQAGFAAGCP